MHDSAYVAGSVVNRFIQNENFITCMELESGALTCVMFVFTSMALFMIATPSDIKCVGSLTEERK